MAGKSSAAGEGAAVRRRAARLAAAMARTIDMRVLRDFFSLPV
jgi:hypothetical protein